MRIGQGYDIHKLVPQRKFVLGGVEIPFDKGPLGHSDGDVLFHAITDALLGAAGLGDIGGYFPDTDPRWKDASSIHFLKEACLLLYKNGFLIENLDGTVHLERPKLAPYLKKIKENLSEVLRLPADRINIKAKTGEGIGEVGRGEAVVAQVIVLLTDQ